MRQLLALTFILAVPLLTEEAPAPTCLTLRHEKFQAAIASRRDTSFVNGNHALVNEILNWLPLDTETVAVSSITIPLPVPASRDRMPDPALGGTGYVLSPLDSLQDGAFAKRLDGQTIALAVLGARRFGNHDPSPSGALPLGMTAFQGCGLYSFTGTVPETAFSGLPKSVISGQPTWTAQGKNYEPASDASKASQAGDLHFLALLKPNLLMVCNDRNFYTTVLSRLASPGRVRALPESLPEWKQLDQSAPFWALRHYDPKRMMEDPSMSLMGKFPAGAVGLTYQIGQPKDSFRLRLLLASDQNPFQMMAQDQQFAGFVSKQIERGVWQLSATFKDSPSPMFSFVAMGMLGFVVLL